jgi:hypothetical protein
MHRRVSHSYQQVLSKEFTKVQDWLVAKFGKAVFDNANIIDQQVEAYIQVLYDSYLPDQRPKIISRYQ